MTPSPKPLDREGWEKRIVEFCDLRKRAMDHNGLFSLGAKEAFEDAIKSGNAIISDILAIQSERNTAISEICTLNNRIEEIDRTYDFQRKVDAEKIAALQSEVERLNRAEDQWEKIWLPVLNFAQSNRDALGIRLGESISEWVLKMMQEKAM